MLDLANHGLPQAMYTYGKNLLIMVQTSRFEKQSEKKRYLDVAMNLLQGAAEHKIWSAFYLLGTIHQSKDLGYYDLNKAYMFYQIDASWNNAYAYYMLSFAHLHGNGIN